MSFQPLRFHRSYLVSLVIALLLVASASAQDQPKIEIVPNIPHHQRVSAVVFSPDGTRVLSGSWDLTIKLWDPATGQLLRTFAGHGQRVSSVAFSPDGTRVLSGSREATVRLWDAATGQLLRTFAGHEFGVRSVAFSPDGTRVLSAGDELFHGDPLLGNIKLWDATSGQLLRTFAEQSTDVTSVAFSPDGSRVLSGGGRDRMLKLWDVATGKLLRTFEGHAGQVWSVAFSPDGTRVLSGGEDKSVKLWDAVSGQLLRTFEGHPGVVHSVAFSPDGSRVLSGGQAAGQGIDAWFPPGNVNLWDTASGQLLRTFEGLAGAVISVAFSPDSTRVLLGSEGRYINGPGDIELWDAATWQLLRTFGGAINRVNSVKFSPDGTLVLSGSSKTIKLWDAGTGRLLRIFAGQHSAVDSIGDFLDPGSANSGSVNSVAFSPDGTRVLSGGHEKAVALWDASTGRLLRTYEGQADVVLSVAFSPDGNHILSGGVRTETKGMEGKGTLELWDTGTGQLLWTIEGIDDGVQSVAFSPDGSRALSGGKATRLWDVATGQLMRTYLVRTFPYGRSVAFSPDGTRVLSGEHGGIMLWDAATGQPSGPADEYNDIIVSVTFSPDGTRLLSGGRAGTLKLWDAASRQLLRTFEGHRGFIRSVAFSPDGARAVSSGDDGAIRIWNVAGGELLTTLFSSESGEWLTLTPEGFFATSRKGSEGLGVVRGLQSYSVEQMYQALFDPDLVRESLAADPDGEVKKAAAVLDLEKVLDSRQAPRVALVSPVNGDSSKDEVISAEARITDAGGGIGRVEWRVNGITVGVANNAPGAGKELTITQRLALESGENTIEVVAYNGRNLLASLPVSTTVTWSAPANQPQPKLFVIAVGINQYNDTLFRPLSFAVADAKAFGAAMKAAGEGLYGKGRVDVTYVLDADATAEKLERMIDEVGAKMNPRDVFIFLAAAHGKSENGRFHLIPQNYRSVSGRFVTEGTIGQEQLQDWFANRIKARRGLILLDTCESGALVASRVSGVDAGNSEAALGRLNEATGRPVLTAAAADQAALEGYHGHGVFTYALLDALVNGDTNNDGKIELSELTAHIQTLAPRLSHELRGGRGAAVAQKSRAAQQLRDASIASRYADYRQKPRMGSRGEDFPLVNRLQALPAASAQ